MIVFLRLPIPFVLAAGLGLSACASTAEINAEYRDVPVAEWPSTTALRGMRH